VVADETEAPVLAAASAEALVEIDRFDHRERDRRAVRILHRAGQLVVVAGRAEDPALEEPDAFVLRDRDRGIEHVEQRRGDHDAYGGEYQIANEDQAVVSRLRSRCAAT
jgi:hypothetical protein